MSLRCLLNFQVVSSRQLDMPDRILGERFKMFIVPINGFLILTLFEEEKVGETNVFSQYVLCVLLKL